MVKTNDPITCLLGPKALISSFFINMFFYEQDQVIAFLVLLFHVLSFAYIQTHFNASQIEIVIAAL